MGSCVSLSIPLDQSVNRVSQWLDEKGGYIHNLKKNLVALTTTTEELKAKRDDLSRRVTREEERGLQRLAEIQVWLNRVDTVESRVNDIVSARNVQLQRLCLCGFCSKSLLSSYRYGKSVFLTLREVEKLKSEVYEVIAEEKVSYTHNLEKNLVDLERAMEELKAKRDDFSRRLKREEDRGLTRLSEFQVWLDRVETIENKVNALLSDRDVEIQRFCYSYGEKIILTLKEVEVLKSKVFVVIAEQALTPEVEELPLQPPIVGQETMLDKAWNHLMEDGVGIMGMYGMGGVGKTTLLTQLNNKFSDVRCGFDFVIWIVVSKEFQVEKILDEIAQKVDLGGEHWSQKNTSQKGVHLFNFLKKKKFMLFLDDIWEKVDLAEIGFPVPTTQNRCKVAFTTRSQDVCARMGVEHPMEVQCLADNDAFDLFQKKVGQVTLGSDPVIPDLAKIVAKKCCGLPLALNVIGETMSCKRTVQEWLDAIQVLNSNAAEFSGMDDKILPLLKYSYDNLKGAQVKQCLLYCALFPEDARIYKEELIEYWICEGIIDGSEGFEMGENKGYAVIGSLVCASLLMDSGYVDGKSVVCMHDVIREMALWIASDLGIQKEAFIVRAGVGLGESPKVKNWNVARRMSLMHNRIYHLAGSPECLELTTLLLQEGTLQNISSEFFKSMPKLTVLDLSGNRLLHELPEGISESLQFLNLSRTGIRHLALQGLGKLIHLDLEETRQLQRIDGISSLHNLKVLKLFGCRRSWTVTELEALKHLEILTVKPVNEQFLRSHRLMSCTRFLGIFNIKSSGISLPATMDKLREFNIFYGSISEIQMGRNCSFLSLVKVRIEDCESLRELTFLMFAPNLKNLEIRSTNRLEDIINKEKACAVENSGVVPFQKLNELSLDDLQELKNIYWSPLPFPYLKEICVNECPNLKKLPLDSQSCRQGENGLIIRYHPKKWIEGVEWEDQATKTHFLASCKLV